MGITGLALAGFTGEFHHEWFITGGKAFEFGFDFGDICKLVQSVCAGSQLPRCLGTAQEQLAQDGHCPFRKLQFTKFGIAETMLVFSDTATVTRSPAYLKLFYQVIDSVLYGGFL